MCGAPHSLLFSWGGIYLYKISDFSKMTGFSKETLRYYAEVKLLEPAYINPENNYRYYDDGSYFLAILLVKLRRFGFTIQEMISVMEDESFAHLEDLLLQKRDNIKMQIEDLRLQVEEIDDFIASGREEME
ncbi:MerR family transcriptional regulator [Bacillus sp. EB106-08-02-XG196]|uniref:MerR family transcriptional regulator n=1 Tax=Bacillus sp. EB106-08-02-XG196 TaxID=2737049 RepID=UPI0027959084|nr:MerR family transcriptional regulator [Bacillus sp. EB106-08-02-XG196]